MFIYEQSGEPVSKEDKVTLHDKPATISRLIPPHKEGASGKIEVTFSDKSKRELFAHVFGAKWVGGPQ